MFAVSRRMAWYVVPVLAVLLGTSILPASAWSGEADEPALYSACVGPRRRMPGSPTFAGIPLPPGCHQLSGPLRDHARDQP